MLRRIVCSQHKHTNLSVCRVFSRPAPRVFGNHPQAMEIENYFANPVPRLEKKNADLRSLLSSEDIQQFIADHENDDERALVLKHDTILGVRSALIAEQIVARRKAKEKLPTWYNTTGIIYPPGVNLEQTSSETTGGYKYTVLRDLLGAGRKVAIDLTGGFGTDTFFLSKLFAAVEYVDPNDSLLEIARHNHRRLGASNITYHPSTAAGYLKDHRSEATLVIIDPSRRTKHKRVFSFSDSEPDVSAVQSAIFERAGFLLVKASPMLDIKYGLRQLTFVKHVFAVAVNNEMKELLFFAEKDFMGEPLIHAVNLTSPSMEEIVFRFPEEESVEIPFHDPQTWLYEPNAAILKAGAFKSVVKKSGIAKIHPSTHLYTSETLWPDFPGRIFRLDSPVTADRKMLQRFFPGSQANVITRNYPLSAEELKKKAKLRDGGEKCLLAFTGLSRKYLFCATRLR